MPASAAIGYNPHTELLRANRVGAARVPASGRVDPSFARRSLADAVLSLQRTAGNRAVTQLVQRLALQSSALEGSKKNYDTDTPADMTRIREHIRRHYRASSRPPLKKFRAQLATAIDVAGEDAKQADRDLLALLDRRITRLKSQKTALREQVGAIAGGDKRNYANAVVFIDDQREEFPLATYRSGIEASGANPYVTPAAAYHPVRSTDEIGISSADSEVTLLKNLEDHITARIDTASQPPRKIFIQVYSTYGACDGCKNRLGLFVDRLKEHVSAPCTIRLKYIYDELLKKARDDTSSYGWLGDPRAEFKKGPSAGPKRADIAGPTGQKHVHFMIATKS